MLPPHSFHRQVLQDPCGATYFLIDTRLDEAAKILVEEFDRLRRDEAATREIRAAFVSLAVSHFPKSSSWKLIPLLRRGCEDPDAGVRQAALESLEELFGPASERILLRSLSMRHTSEIGRDAMECLMQLNAKTDGADPNPLPEDPSLRADPRR